MKNWSQHRIYDSMNQWWHMTIFSARWNILSNTSKHRNEAINEATKSQAVEFQLKMFSVKLSKFIAATLFNFMSESFLWFYKKACSPTFVGQLFAQICADFGFPMKQFTT